MPSPHLFDSDVDYYESLMSEETKELNSILENDPASYMDDHGIMQDFFDTYFEDIFDYAFDKGLVQEYLEGYVKEQRQIRMEP